jgi:hypothetical protein
MLVLEVYITVFPLQLLPTSYTFFSAIMYSLNSFLAIFAIASALPSVSGAIFDKMKPSALYDRLPLPLVIQACPSCHQETEQRKD